jgi:TonB-linked SusC/RagA family outer membrane protein
MRQFYCLLLLLFLLPLSLLAQKTISGKVTDENKNPLAGSTISVKGRMASTVSDANGNFTLNAPNLNSSLIVSSVGYLTEEFPLKGKSTIVVSMSIKEATLEDVVVIGYGTVRKQDLTGAVTSVKINEQEAAQITSIDKLLQGRAAGVTVNSGSAAPGGAVNVRIRGTSTFTGGSEPLYVVDGVIINTATQDVDNSLRAGTNPGNSYQEAQNGLTAINPQDIESIEILKDASATAIYGSRGANGVVLITTKQGKSGRGIVVFNSTTEFAQVTKKIPVLDAYEFAEFRNKTRAMQGQNLVYDLKTIEPIDWQDDVYRTGITTNNRASFSGKNDKGNYFLALGFLNNNGVIPTTGVKQGDLRFNITQNVSSKLKFSSRTGLIYRRNSMTQATEQMGSASNSIIRQMLAKEPIIDTLGPTLANLNEDIEGPRAWLRDYDDISKEFRVIL